MKTCKDCIHYEVCHAVELAGILENAYGCKNFKDKDLYIKLPCKIGDTVYTNLAWVGQYLRKCDRPYPCTVLFIGLNGTNSFINIEYQKTKHQIQMKFSDLGETIFLTKEEAEAELKRRIKINES